MPHHCKVPTLLRPQRVLFKARKLNTLNINLETKCYVTESTTSQQLKYFLYDYDYLIIIASMKEMLPNGFSFSVSSWAACAYSKRKKSSK